MQLLNTYVWHSMLTASIDFARLYNLVDVLKLMASLQHNLQQMLGNDAINVWMLVVKPRCEEMVESLSRRVIRLRKASQTAEHEFIACDITPRAT